MCDQTHTHTTDDVVLSHILTVKHRTVTNSLINVIIATKPKYDYLCMDNLS